MLALHLRQKKKENTLLKRRFTNNNKLLFLQKLQSTNWDELCNTSSDADCQYNAFLKKFTFLFESSFPSEKINVNRKHMPRKTWITHRLAKSCRTKDKLYKRFIKHPIENNKFKYTNYRNKLKSLLKKTEITFYKKKFNQYKTNIKLTWKTANCILNQKNLTPITDSFLINNVLVTDKT